jgi:photosystem I subunit V
MVASQAMASSMTVRPSTGLVARRPAARTTVRAPLRTRHVTRAISDVNIVIGGSTVAALALGRFVFLPFQRKAAEKAGLPTQNGVTHAEAGDRLAQVDNF